nr:hypothetical protein [Tanacetum cinerariifolium]
QMGPGQQLLEQQLQSRQELGAPPPPHWPLSPSHHPHHPMMTPPRHHRHLLHRLDNQ